MLDPAVRPHLGGALNVGVTVELLKELLSLLEILVGEQEAQTAKQILDEVVRARKSGEPMQL